MIEPGTRGHCRMHRRRVNPRHAAARVQQVLGQSPPSAANFDAALPGHEVATPTTTAFLHLERSARNHLRRRRARHKPARPAGSDQSARDDIRPTTRSSPRRHNREPAAVSLTARRCLHCSAASPPAGPGRPRTACSTIIASGVIPGSTSFNPGGTKSRCQTCRRSTGVSPPSSQTDCASSSGVGSRQFCPIDSP